MKSFFSFIALFLLFSCISGRKPSAKNTETDSLFVQTDTVSLLFAGDVMQHLPQVRAAKNANGYDYSPCFKWVRDEIGKADFAVANLECTLGGIPYSGYPMFSAPDELLFGLHDAGFDVLTTANNHCLDRGRKGLERTLRLIDSIGIKRVGTYHSSEDRMQKSPLLLQKGRLRIALLAYTYGTNGIPVTPPNCVNFMDTTTISKDIAACRELHPDAIIACLHWGNEYQRLPDSAQRELAVWMLGNGVDHIVGAHPHVIQPVEVLTDSLQGKRHVVAYSLGNYISNQSKPHTDGGMMLRMTLIKDSIATRLHDCNYSLVWTGRPVQTGKKNYYILPVDFPSDSLAVSARHGMEQFAHRTRTFLRKHNRGIEEYSIGQKP